VFTGGYDDALLNLQIQQSPVACLEKVETVSLVRKALNSMPVNHRALVVLRDMEGRSFEEIAQILGCSVESARSRLCRARNILRERLRPLMAEVDI
jgi:RNA polymerase sigma-70 factor (ECF subfamily)